MEFGLLLVWMIGITATFIFANGSNARSLVGKLCTIAYVALTCAFGVYLIFSMR